MTISASIILHAISGSPVVPECSALMSPGCWHCGASLARGMLVDDWQGALFVGQNRVRGRQDWTHICEPCVWVMSRAPGVVPGKPPTHNWRLYTVLVHGDEVWIGNKADKPAILLWLRQPKPKAWFAAIADSGQKHVVPYAPVNPAGTAWGRVQLEEDVVSLSADLWSLVADTAALLTAGATKDSIASGQYQPGEWQRCGVERLRDYERRAARVRGGPGFRLALWLAQRDEVEVAERMEREKEAKRGKGRRDDNGDVATADGGCAARPAKRVPQGRGKPAQALGSDPGPDAGGREDECERRGVAHVDVPVAPVGSAEQLGLFGAR